MEIPIVDLCAYNNLFFFVKQLPEKTSGLFALFFACSGIVVIGLLICFIFLL